MPAAPTSLAAEGMPLHRQLFLVLRDQIRRGAFGPAAPLPTEQELGRLYGVSRITVRRALQDLAEQGWVERRHGRGTFVRETAGAVTAIPSLTLLDGMRKAQMETEASLVDLAVRPVPATVAHHLGQDEGTPALVVLRVRRGPDGPLMITESWLPERFAVVVTPEALSSRALFEVLLDAGVTFGRVVQEITAEVADPTRARLLDIAIGDPLLRLNRVVQDSGDAPVQFLGLTLSPARSRILMEIPASQLDTALTGMVAHDVGSPLTDRR